MLEEVVEVREVGVVLESRARVAVVVARGGLDSRSAKWS